MLYIFCLLLFYFLQGGFIVQINISLLQPELVNSFNKKLVQAVLNIKNMLLTIVESQNTLAAI